MFIILAEDPTEPNTGDINTTAGVKRPPPEGMFLFILNSTLIHTMVKVVCRYLDLLFIRLFNTNKKKIKAGRYLKD